MKLLSTLFLSLLAATVLALPSPTLLKAAPAKPNSSPPTITRPPISQIVTQGNTIRLSVIASNPKPNDKVITYQWYKNGVAIPGATTYYMDFVNIQHSAQALYTVGVTNSSAGVTSAGSLTVPTTNIVSACVVSNTVNLSWAYDYLHNPDLGFFQVFYGTNSGAANGQLIISKTTTNASVHNLLSANTYYFVAQAVSTNGIKSPSSPQLSQQFGYFCGIPYTIDIVMLTNNVPRITAKLCPACLVGVQRSTDLTNWNTIGATTADKYGNIMFDDYTTATNNSAYYRLITQ